MKRLSNLLAALVFASLVIFMSCGGGGSDPAPDPFAEAAVELTASGWSPTAVTDPDDANQLTQWSDFTLSFTGNENGGNYSVTNVPAGFEAVWPTSGTWEFGSTTSVIERSDNVTITAEITATQLTLQFNISTGARASSIDGDWAFVFGN